MERIVLEVDNTIAKRWKQASYGLKKQAVEALGQMLDTNKYVENVSTKDNRDKRVQKAVAFFRDAAADFTGYKFNREEANER